MVLPWESLRLQLGATACMGEGGGLAVRMALGLVLLMVCMLVATATLASTTSEKPSSLLLPLKGDCVGTSSPEDWEMLMLLRFVFSLWWGVGRSISRPFHFYMEDDLRSTFIHFSSQQI